MSATRLFHQPCLKIAVIKLYCLETQGSYHTILLYILPRRKQYWIFSFQALVLHKKILQKILVQRHFDISVSIATHAKQVVSQAAQHAINPRNMISATPMARRHGGKNQSWDHNIWNEGVYHNLCWLWCCHLWNTPNKQTHAHTRTPQCLPYLVKIRYVHWGLP